MEDGGWKMAGSGVSMVRCGDAIVFANGAMRVVVRPFAPTAHDNVAWGATPGRCRRQAPGALKGRHRVVHRIGAGMSRPVRAHHLSYDPRALSPRRYSTCSALHPVAGPLGLISRVTVAERRWPGAELAPANAKRQCPHRDTASFLFITHITASSHHRRKHLWLTSARP
jgi:hypothetical protein